MTNNNHMRRKRPFPDSYLPLELLPGYTDFLPADLQPNEITTRKYPPIEQGLFARGKDKESLIQLIAENVQYIASTKILRRGFVTRNVSVGTTPTLLIKAQFLRGYILINNSQAAWDVIYLGDRGVTTDSGFPFFGGDTRELYLEENCELYGVAVSSLDLRILEL